MLRILLSLILVSFSAEALAALTWMPNATGPAGAAEYTIKNVWDYSDGSNLILQVEVNEAASYPGCSSSAANTFFTYSTPMNAFHETLSNKLLAAEMSGYKIKVAINPGVTNWCHPYGLLIYGLDLVIPNQ